jgi:hypothetical protein
VTPFQAGRCIELSDFTLSEAKPLANGLGADPALGQQMLARVLYWTGGHPYLSQRMCRAIVEDGSIKDPAGVDRLARKLFIRLKAGQDDDNIAFVQRSILANSELRIRLLTAYGQIRQRKPCLRPSGCSDILDMLRASGIVRRAGAGLVVRNRIYAQVFNNAWIRANLTSSIPATGRTLLSA